MALSLNKPKLDNLASDIWKSAERLRGKFKSYEYQSVILPIIVIRRLECVLIDWREKKAAEVLKNRPKLTEKERLRQPIVGDLAAGRKNADGDREVEGAAAFLHVGRGEIHRDSAQRQLIAGIAECGRNALTSFLDCADRQAHGGK